LFGRFQLSRDEILETRIRLYATAHADFLQFLTRDPTRTCLYAITDAGFSQLLPRDLTRT
jgi:hypothetical protein